jgi:uncharacterized protein with NRDE domain
MCLLVFSWQMTKEHPLMVAANRDERLDRAAQSIRVLRERNPRVLGGRDDVAGGTWLAVNEHGVVAGLTNRPSPGGRDLTKRSRGELPLMVASQRSAEEGVAELTRTVLPGQYNPAWLLVGDREGLYYVELTIDGPPSSRPLSPGIHVLENVALGEPSPKVDWVLSQLSTVEQSSTAEQMDRSLWTAMSSVLSDHTIPSIELVDNGTTERVVRKPATLAPCVHTDDYGTRSAALVRVPADPLEEPDMLVADGPPCTNSFVDVSPLWTS